MIRINLLPVRAVKKKESIRLQLSIAAFSTVVVLISSMAVYATMSSKASSLSEEIAKGEQEIEVLKKKVGELSKIKEQKRVVEEKLRIINDLEAARTGPVNMFKMISSAIPETAWLLSVKDDPGAIVIKGYASNDEVVADFMRNLQKRKDQLALVELEVAQRVSEKETNSDVVEFTLRLEKAKRADKDQSKDQTGQEKEKK